MAGTFSRAIGSGNGDNTLSGGWMDTAALQCDAPYFNGISTVTFNDTPIMGRGVGVPANWTYELAP